MSPHAHRHDDVVQIFARFGEPVVDHARLAGARATITPASSNSLSRFDRSVGDMRGTPRRMSLNRVEPQSISRNTSAVQREQRTSAAMAMGQNCP